MQLGSNECDSIASMQNWLSNELRPGSLLVCSVNGMVWRMGIIAHSKSSTEWGESNGSDPTPLFDDRMLAYDNRDVSGGA